MRWFWAPEDGNTVSFLDDDALQRWLPMDQQSKWHQSGSATISSICVNNSMRQTRR